MINSVVQFIKLVLKAFDASTLKGMYFRYRFAIIFSIIAIVADSMFVCVNYNYLPRTVAVFYNWDYVAVQWADKSSFWYYELQRLVVLAIMLLIGRGVRLFNRKSVIFRRTECLFADTAMLIILTGVGISIAMLFVSLGNDCEIKSDYWECVFMLFWFVVSIVEYLLDCGKLKKKGVSL